MEEYKNGVISEEALEEVAGGLKVNKARLKKVLALQGVGIVAIGLGYGGYKFLSKKETSKKNNGTEFKTNE